MPLPVTSLTLMRESNPARSGKVRTTWYTKHVVRAWFLRKETPMNILAVVRDIAIIIFVIVYIIVEVA